MVLAGKISKFSSALRSRGNLLADIVVWLVPLAWKHNAGALVAAAATALASVPLQYALGMTAISAIGQVQSSGHLRMFPVLDRVGIYLERPSAIFLVLTVLGLMFLAALCRYISRRIAIQIEGRLYTQLTEKLLNTLSREGHSLTDHARLSEKIGFSDVFQVVLSDARFCGIAVRIALYNSAQVGAFLFGLCVLLFVAPWILVGTLGLVGVGLMIVYPLNLEAVRISRALEEMSIDRGALLRRQVDGAMRYGGTRGSGGSSVSDENLLKEHLSLWGERLQVIETSRVAMSLVVGFGLALFLWVAIQPLGGQGRPDDLLISFMGFLFTTTGLVGLVVMVTTINRFLPNIYRVYRLCGAVEFMDFNVSRQVSSSRPVALNKLVWRFSPQLAGGRIRQGEIAPGRVICILTHTADTKFIMAQLLSILSEGRMAFAKACDHYLQELSSIKWRIADDVLANDDEAVCWIQSVVSKGGYSGDEMMVRESLRGGAAPNGPTPE